MSHRSDPRLLVLHGLRQLGTADAERLALHFERSTDEFSESIDGLVREGLLEQRHGRFPGYRLRPEGRVVGDALVADELRELGIVADVARLHEAFESLDAEILSISAAWQLRGEGPSAVTNDHADAEYDRAVIERLAALHTRLQPVTDELSTMLHRYLGHHHRLQAALDAAVAGDHDYVTRSMFPSYHSCWHELHEDLLVSTGNGRN